MKEDKNISIWKPSFIHQRFSHILKEKQNDFSVDSMYSETEAVSSRHKTHKAKHKLMFEIITIKLKYPPFKFLSCSQKAEKMYHTDETFK